jgi:sulfite exporter TauE/SafE
MLELTVPAAFAAGLAASTHCAVMCGPLQAIHLRARGAAPLARALGEMHAGRIGAYAALGALAGATGGAWLMRLPPLQAGTAIQLSSSLALLAFGALQFSGRSRAGCCPPAAAGAGRRWLARGALWALTPCPTLYALLPLALFSGSAGAGALLLGAFGLGTLPALGASGALLQRFGVSRAPMAGAVLLGAGLAGIAMALATPALAAWCRGVL